MRGRVIPQSKPNKTGFCLLVAIVLKYFKVANMVPFGPPGEYRKRSNTICHPLLFSLEPLCTPSSGYYILQFEGFGGYHLISQIRACLRRQPNIYKQLNRSSFLSTLFYYFVFTLLHFSCVASFSFLFLSLPNC
jgi:hypothetical protein